jgi:ribosome maturation factor RimP
MIATERTLARDIVPAVERSVPGVEVLAVELLSPSRFCVYVDHPEGVDHALCARVTELLSDYRGSYTIDVSSPGLDRPVRRPEHFRAALGRDVQLRTADDIAGKKRFRGTVVAATEQSARIAVGDAELDIPYETIVRGNLIDEG